MTTEMRNVALVSSFHGAVRLTRGLNRGVAQLKIDEASLCHALFPRLTEPQPTTVQTERQPTVRRERSGVMDSPPRWGSPELEVQLGSPGRCHAHVLVTREVSRKVSRPRAQYGSGCPWIQGRLATTCESTQLDRVEQARENLV